MYQTGSLVQNTHWPVRSVKGVEMTEESCVGWSFHPFRSWQPWTEKEKVRDKHCKRDGEREIEALRRRQGSGSGFYQKKNGSGSLYIKRREFYKFYWMNIIDFGQNRFLSPGRRSSLMKLSALFLQNKVGSWERKGRKRDIQRQREKELTVYLTVKVLPDCSWVLCSSRTKWEAIGFGLHPTRAYKLEILN